MNAGKKAAIAAVLGIAVGAIGFGFTLVSESTVSAANDTTNSSSDFSFGQKGVNAAGETYGPLESFDNPPDLFEAYATNNKVGYVRFSDLWSVIGPPESLSDAVSPKQDNHYLNVYDKDGKTIIGEYVVRPGSGQ